MNNPAQTNTGKCTLSAEEPLDAQIEGILQGRDLNAHHASHEFNRAYATLVALSARRIARAIDRFTDSNSQLSTRLLWLNWILGFLTFVGAVASGVGVWLTITA